MSTLGHILFGTPITAAEKFGDQGTFLGAILLYNILLTSFAALLGWGARQFLRWTKWDLSFPFLRFNNEWFYLLRGETVLFGESQIVDLEKFEKKIVSCKAYAMVKTVGDVAYIYSGSVHKFYLNREGSLETIVLRDAEKAIVASGGLIGVYNRIGTDLVILKYEEIFNISFQVFALPKTLSPKKGDNKTGAKPAAPTATS